MTGAGNRPTKIKLPYGAKVNTPDFGSGNPRSNRGGATRLMEQPMENNFSGLSRCEM